MANLESCNKRVDLAEWMKSNEIPSGSNIVIETQDSSRKDYYLQESYIEVFRNGTAIDSDLANNSQDTDTECPLTFCITLTNGVLEIPDVALTGCNITVAVSSEKYHRIDLHTNDCILNINGEIDNLELTATHSEPRLDMPQVSICGANIGNAKLNLKGCGLKVEETIIKCAEILTTGPVTSIKDSTIEKLVIESGPNSLINLKGLDITDFRILSRGHVQIYECKGSGEINADVKRTSRRLKRKRLPAIKIVGHQEGHVVAKTPNGKGIVVYNGNRSGIIAKEML